MPVYDDGTVHRAALRCLLTLGSPPDDGAAADEPATGGPATGGPAAGGPAAGGPAAGGPAGDGPRLDRLHLGLALHFDGALYSSGHAENDFDGALAEIQRQLPPGAYLKSCLSCAFSDYFPAAGAGFFGALACFGDAKEEYRAVRDKDAVLEVWDRNSGFVQETHRCPDFERGPAEGRGTGHRGPFPGPRGELRHVQGDFKPPQASTA